MGLESIASNPAEKYRLLLNLAKTASAQLDFGSVLETICESLQPYVRVDAVGVISMSGDRVVPEELYVRGVMRGPRESWRAQADRVLGLPPDGVRTELTPLLSAPGSGTAWVMRERKMYFADLTEARRFSEEEAYYRLGARSYVRAPLIVRDRLVGLLEFIRTIFVSPEPPPFTRAEAEFLGELADPLASTVVNSLAYEEIAALKRQIEMENVALREEFDEELMFGEIVGTSRPLRRLLASLDKVAATDATVLITGETGTGKELVAREIHRRSRRSARPMIKVNCAALPQNLVASELFGHEKGAFTGALQRRLGRFELASKGTLFLDEIGELTLDVQASLLRVLQEGEFERVGGTQTLRSDSRLIAATNRDLQAEVAAGRFRADLFYRLSVFPIAVPSLRERREDIPLLLEYFVARHSSRLGKRVTRIEKASMERLTAYAWPGNIRELQNVVERATILADGDRLVVEPSFLSAPRSVATPGAGGLTAELGAKVKEAIEEALRAASGRVSGPDGAAARLGMRPTTLHSKIARYGIDKRRFR